MYKLVSPSFRCFILNLDFIGQEKIFEYNGNIHIYCPRVGAGQPLGSNFFQKNKSSVHLLFSFKFFSSNDILTNFPIQMQGQHKLTCRKMGQGHPRVMIYINFVEHLSLMLHAKFQNHRPSGSGEDF